LGAVVNTGQHDQRSHGGQRVGGRQQHGNRGHRANAWQHTNQGAQQAADERINQVLEGERHPKTEGQVIDQIGHE
jgi:hypothetical protein